MIPASFYAHVLGGVLLFKDMIKLLMNFRRVPYENVMLLLSLSIAASVHGLSHQGLEWRYGYYPLGV